MKIVYTSIVPANLTGGIILFGLKDRIMSKIKSRIWKTFSHAGVVYKSSFTGSERIWISYMDEIYGLVSCPLNSFLNSPALNGWIIRPLTEPVTPIYTRFKEMIANHSNDDSNLYISEEGEIAGSFDEELKTILGIPVRMGGSGMNTNLGYVEDILEETCNSMGIVTGRGKKIEFDDEYSEEEELMERLRVVESEGGLLKSVTNLLSMVNLTTQSVHSPIQPLISHQHKILADFVYHPSSDFSTARGHGMQSSIFPSLSEERKHAAGVISKMFQSGLGSEDLNEVFEEELETTTLARRGRNELSRELLVNLLDSMDSHLTHIKTLLDKKTLPTTADKKIYNEKLHDLITAEGSMLVHLGVQRKINYKDMEL